MTEENVKTYPLLVLRDTVLFPGNVSPLFVGRQKSINALQEAFLLDKLIVVSTQKDPIKDNPSKVDIYKHGTIAKIVQSVKMPDGTFKVLVEALDRCKIIEYINNNGFFEVRINIIKSVDNKSKRKDFLAYGRTILSEFEAYSFLNKKINPDILLILKTISDPSLLTDIVSSNMPISLEDKQKLLEEKDIGKRLDLILKLIEKEKTLLEAEKKIKSRVESQMKESQKVYYLNEQMKAIQKELSDGNGGASDFDELETRINKTKASKEAKEKLNSEFRKLKMMSPMSAEASIIRNYIDTILSLPWSEYSKVTNDIKKAEKILDRDHYGLDKVKERILEFLAVQQRMGKLNGPILCLVGPPGVGKTSLARSIADATSRQYTKFALGGMRDEAEIRGHRKTYVGAGMGRVLQLLKKAKTSNPVMLLDEIDKLSYSDHRGDPSSALLEVLDPEQNTFFNDHYLELDYDLSKVLFIATANSLNIPRPLLDRMEVIRLSGYTEDEKCEIAKRHLIPKVLEANGLKDGELSIKDEAIITLIRHYTMEAGVRGLEREIAKIARKVLKKILEKKIKSADISNKNVADYSGVRKFDIGEAETENLVGVTTGLAYTEVGGDLLHIEAVLLPGKGEIVTTGKLGEVMQESAKAAYSFFKSTSVEYGIIPPRYLKKNIHLHVPEGATPKDGPSAGVAIFTSIVSAMTSIPVKKNVAMTGEITLRGRVLRIGGLKEKLLAALRGGIKTVLIPSENEKDLEEIPVNIINNLEIIPIKYANEALKFALSKKVKQVEWLESDNLEENSKENSIDDVVTH